MSKIDLDPLLDSPELAADHRLRAILKRGFELRTPRNAEGPASDATRAHFSPEYFRLDKTARFRDLEPAGKSAVIVACSDALLREAYFIEKGGMYYTAKMSLLSKTTQERMLYSQFSADEATHFHLISQYLPAELAGSFRGNSFLSQLVEVATTEGKVVLTYILQVILEGWGLRHYREMADHCTTPGLKSVFETIVRDEARHHGSGILLFNGETISEQEISRITAIMAEFMKLIQSGPQVCVAEVSRANGGLDRDVLEEIFSDLGTVEETRRRILIVTDCIRSVQGSDEILRRLTDKGALEPWSPAVCAGILAGLQAECANEVI